MKPRHQLFAPLAAREYRSYDEYVQHQASKLDRITDIERLDREYEQVLSGRLQDAELQPGMSVLCLGARRGGEVRAFLGFGCFAVGIDLNPGERNANVVAGDFHDLQFADQSVDMVFTNSIDHSIDPARVLSEVGRVLKPVGRLILEIGRGTEHDDPSDYESFVFDNPQTVIELVERHGFRLLTDSTFSQPWRGHHLRFAKR
jgi:SAM-dependent methyltransferase